MRLPSLVKGPILLQHPIGVLESLEPLWIKGCLKSLGASLAGEHRSSPACLRSLDGNHGWAFLEMRWYSGTRVARVSRAHVGFARDAMRHVDFVRDTECHVGFARDAMRHVWVDQQMDLISISVAGRLRCPW